MADGPWRRARLDSPVIIVIIIIIIIIITTTTTISEVGTSGRRPLAAGKA